MQERGRKSATVRVREAHVSDGCARAHVTSATRGERDVTARRGDVDARPPGEKVPHLFPEFCPFVRRSWENTRRNIVSFDANEEVTRNRDVADTPGTKVGAEPRMGRFGPLTRAEGNGRPKRRRRTPRRHSHQSIARARLARSVQPRAQARARVSSRPRCGLPYKTLRRQTTSSRVRTVFAAGRGT